MRLRCLCEMSAKNAWLFLARSERLVGARMCLVKRFSRLGDAQFFVRLAAHSPQQRVFPTISGVYLDDQTRPERPSTSAFDPKSALHDEPDVEFNELCQMDLTCAFVVTNERFDDCIVFEPACLTPCPVARLAKVCQEEIKRTSKRSRTCRGKNQFPSPFSSTPSTS